MFVFAGIAAGIWAIAKFVFHAVTAHWVAILLAVLVGLGVFLAFSSRADGRRQRDIDALRADLELAYKDPRIVERIMAGQIWEGQSPEQLRDSIGLPVDIDRSVNSRSVTEVWKYGRVGQNRYRLRVTVRNGSVIGWESKN